jgi:Tfp pilus assembly protein PilX
MLAKNIRANFGSRRGFTLIITISQLVLLTMIAIGLLSLSSVSLRTSSRGDASATARANARLALMMAIGELPKELGPDSRISAPHDAGTAATGGQPRWTAGYDAWKREDNPSTTKLTPANNQFGRRFEIRSFRWLKAQEV